MARDQGIIGVIQARMGSTRVPGKALLNLAGKPLLWHIIDRMRRVKHIEKIVLATSTAPENDVLRGFAEENKIGFYAYPGEDDLAGRVSGAIKNLQGDFILKTGGDCPLIDPHVLQKIVNLGLNNSNADFVSNRIEWSYPLGLSADLISRTAIEWADENLFLSKDREFFALYIRDHNKQFNVIPCKNEVDLSHHIWTVDDPEDVEFMQSIFDALYREGEVFGMTDVLQFLEKNASE
jgi:spore coat polysaccharide biosynthesis protein SpsF